MTANYITLQLSEIRVQGLGCMNNRFTCPSILSESVCVISHQLAPHKLITQTIIVPKYPDPKFRADPCLTATYTQNPKPTLNSR